MITKNYIKMCEKAEEIQKAWKPVDWDRFIYKDDRELGIAYIDNKHNKKAMKKVNEKYIWLPTQEQLQEMIKEDFLAEFGMIFKLYNWIDNGIHCGIFNFDIKEITINELWLAFVMKKKWNKEWDDNKWK